MPANSPNAPVELLAGVECGAFHVVMVGMNLLSPRLSWRESHYGIFVKSTYDETVENVFGSPQKVS